MMRVLDIDLDFFLADCCPLAPIGGRPELKGHEPWEAEAVIRFLEQQCGLSKNAPVPGAIFETHDGALCFWETEIMAGRLKAPFSVTHIDAHSDLAIGKPGPRFILENVLSRHPSKRADIQCYYDAVQLDEANYLLFACAFRWVAELENVRNPKSRPDIPAQITIQDEDGRYTGLQLVSGVSRLFEPINGPEPVIPFAVYDDPYTYQAKEPFDYVTLAISPRYAPKEADALVPVIGQYIKEC